MAKGQTRLWRKTGAVDNLFEFSYGSTVLTDKNISSIVIHRGGGEGITPSTAEVQTNVYASVAAGDMCAVSLSTYGNALINSIAGDSGTTRVPRFKGRIGQQTIDDRGKRQYTTYRAASQSAQLPAIKYARNFAAGTLVRDVIRDLLNPPSLPAYTWANQAPTADFGTLKAAINGATFADTMGKVTADLGILSRETRAGGIQLQTHAYRDLKARESLGSKVPLSRSQGLAPAVWEQGNETRPRNYLLKYWNTAGQLVQQIYGDVADTLAEVIELDMSHVVFSNTAQPAQEAFARRAREWLTAYTLPKVTVDLLALLSSKNAYDHLQAVNMLNLQVGEPVYLSDDWHSNLQGIQYAEEITETITPDAWTLELSLAPSQEVTGYTSPDVPARTWDQANYPWNEETRTWNGA